MFVVHSSRHACISFVVGPNYKADVGNETLNMTLPVNYTGDVGLGINYRTHRNSITQWTNSICVFGSLEITCSINNVSMQCYFQD